MTELNLHDVTKVAVTQAKDYITLKVTQEQASLPGGGIAGLAPRPREYCITEITLYPQRDGRISVTIGDD